MFKKIIHFVKYNNAVVFIMLAVFVLGSGGFAQTEAGQEFIGQKQTVVEGVDNTLLLEADLDSFDMDFKIEKIESDEKYYYITYTYLDLLKNNNTWLYEMQEKVRKISIKIDKELGAFVAEELSEQYLARIVELKKQKGKQEQVEQVRIELTEYDGLIGQTLSLATKVFPDYKAVKKKELPSPSVPSLLSLQSVEKQANEQIADDLTDVYNDYIIEMDPDQDDIFGNGDNCPNDFNPLQTDSDNDGLGDLCDNTDDNQADDDESLVPVDEDVIDPVDEVLPEVDEEVVEDLLTDELLLEQNIIEDEVLLEEDIIEIISDGDVEIIELN